MHISYHTYLGNAHTCTILSIKIDWCHGAIINLLNETLYKINKDQTSNNQIINSRAKIDLRKHNWHHPAQTINTIYTYLD